MLVQTYYTPYSRPLGLVASDIVESLNLVDRFHFPAILLVLNSIMENWPFSASARMVKQVHHYHHFLPVCAADDDSPDAGAEADETVPRAWAAAVPGL